MGSEPTIVEKRSDTSGDPRRRADERFLTRLRVETPAGPGYGVGVRIPMDRLSREALLGVVDDFILREGTDYGHGEPTLEEKRTTVIRRLREGEAHIVFDRATETCSIVRDATR